MDDLERCDPQAFEPLGAGHQIDLMMSIGQASVRFDLDHGSRFWSACRIEGSIDLLVAPAPLALHLETIDGWPDLHRVPADMHRSRRPYVVVPLVMPDEALAEKWEQRLGAVSPSLGSKAPLYVRFRRMGDRQSVLRWRLEPVMGLRWGRW